MIKLKRSHLYKLALISPLLLMGCANSNLPPASQILQQKPLTATQLKQTFIGKTFNANITNGRFGGRYKVEIKKDSKVIIDDGRHYRSWHLEEDKVCIESCFYVYNNEQTPNVYYAIVNDQINLILKPYR